MQFLFYLTFLLFSTTFLLFLSRTVRNVCHILSQMVMDFINNIIQLYNINGLKENSFFQAICIVYVVFLVLNNFLAVNNIQSTWQSVY